MKSQSSKRKRSSINQENLCSVSQQGRESCFHHVCLRQQYCILENGDSTFHTYFVILCRGTVINQQVIIGTHGKLKSWQGKRMINYRTMKILVLDEADEMLKVPFFTLQFTTILRFSISKLAI